MHHRINHYSQEKINENTKELKTIEKKFKTEGGTSNHTKIERLKNNGKKLKERLRQTELSQKMKDELKTVSLGKVLEMCTCPFIK